MTSGSNARVLVAAASRQGATAEMWLFSSGPIADPPKPEEAPVVVAGIHEKTSAREHRVFVGKIDKSRLGEKAIMVAVRAPEGDFRDWREIDGRANEFAGALAAERRPT